MYRWHIAVNLCRVDGIALSEKDFASGGNAVGAMNDKSYRNNLLVMKPVSCKVTE